MGNQKVVVIGCQTDFLQSLTECLTEGKDVAWCETWAIEEVVREKLREKNVNTVIYGGTAGGTERNLPLPSMERCFKECVDAGLDHVIVISSAAINEPTYRHAGCVSEEKLGTRRANNRIAASWWDLEKLAKEILGKGSQVRLTLLRPTWVARRQGKETLTNLFFGRFSMPLAGHDPTIQILSMTDLVRAVRCTLENGKGGIYNVVPTSAVPLRKALNVLGRSCLPLPRWVRWLAGKFVNVFQGDKLTDSLEYLRYSWTVSGAKAAATLGFTAKHSSTEALAEAARSGKVGAFRSEKFDDYGLDKEYMETFGRTLFKILHDYYWRIEVQGLENVPQQGAALLAGTHRGFQPWDGVMAVHLLKKELGRHLRFLIHPGLIKFPFLANYITKLGGVIACQENAQNVVANDQLLGVFPEGIRGAFSLYRDAYTVGKFGRNDFIKIALRCRVPIVPFVTVGSAEIFPIYAKYDWAWWKRYSDWPCFPLTPTLGLLPLPSKWHTKFLPPLPVHHWYPPEAAGDPIVVKKISQEVKSLMQAAIDDMKMRRKSIFYGSVFQPEGAVQ